MKYKYIIFDCFGTLIDDGDIVVKSKALKENLTDAQNLVFIAHWRHWHRNNYSFDKFIKDIKSTGIFDDEKIELIKDRVNLGAFTLYDDVIPTLKFLKEKGCKLAILSNAPPNAKEEYENSKALNTLVDEAFWSCDLGCGKPEKQIFNSVLTALKCKKDEALYVGDSYENDYLGAKNAGIDSILIDRQNKFNFKISIKSLSELINLT